MHCYMLEMGDYLLEARFQSGERPAGWMRWTAVACALLLVFAATVQVAHSHANEKAGEHCQICFAIHPAMPAQATVPRFVFTSTHEAAPEIIHAFPARFWISPYANGPPSLRTA
jgi:hypothetical protein